MASHKSVRRSVARMVQQKAPSDTHSSPARRWIQDVASMLNTPKSMSKHRCLELNRECERTENKSFAKRNEVHHHHRTDKETSSFHAANDDGHAEAHHTRHVSGIHAKRSLSGQAHAFLLGELSKALQSLQTFFMVQD
jgi:hypothetical protein